MLDFRFTPEQEAYRAQLRALALEELLPHYQRNDAEQRYPREQIRRVVAFGEDFWRDRDGGPDLISVGITAEEVARGDFNVVLPSLGAAYRTQFFADVTSEQEERWLPGLLSGDQTIGLAITEREAGSDMGKLATSAERHGDHYLLNGEKNSVSFLNGDVFYVFARTDSRPAAGRASRPSSCPATRPA